jgi:hypothetical protein
MRLWQQVIVMRYPYIDLGQCQGFIVAVVAIALVWIVFDRLGQ